MSRSRIVQALAAAIVGAACLPVTGQEAATAPARDPGGMMDRAAQTGSQVYVDDSFASVDKLRTAIRHAGQDQAQLAINEFQAIINDFGQKLVYLNDNSYVSITDYVRERLVQMPAVRKGMYDQLFGGEAKKAVESAQQRQDLAGLISACDRYFPSSAAYEGLTLAGEWYFERGEFVAAARTWRTLFKHPLASKQRPMLLFRTAVAETLSQNTAAARTLREQLAQESPDAAGEIAGAEVRLLDRLDAIIAMPAWEGVELAQNDWPAFEGGPTRTRVLNVSAAIGARLWSQPYSDLAAAEEKPVVVQPNAPVRRFRQVQQVEDAEPSCNSFVVMANGTLFAHTGDRVLAISANAGTQLWSFPVKAAPLMDPQVEAMYRNNYGAVPRINTHNSVSVFGDQVFAVLPAGPGTPARRGRVSYGYDPSGLLSSRLVAISRDDGHELWSRFPSDIKIDEKNTNAIGGLQFVGSPTVTRQGVYVMARRQADGSFTQQYLVRLDRETGAVSWCCYLCSTSTGSMYYGNPNMSIGTATVPAIVDDIVYIATGQGADCAVDANAGRILWLRVNPSDKNKSDPNMGYQAMPAAPSWKANPPLIHGELMIVAESPLVRVYNRADGKLLRSIAVSDLGLQRLDVIAGVTEGQLVLTGDRAVAVPVSALTGTTAIKPTWWADVAEGSAGRPQGRPFLASAYLYVPYEKKLLRVEVRSGKSDMWDWPTTERETPGKPGNLLVTGEQVIVATDGEIAGYSRWETARDNRLATISARPADPEPQLSLAEISFRTNHGELAQEHMRKSVELAIAAEQSSGTAGSTGLPKAEVAALLGRLYRTNLTFAEQLLKKSDGPLRAQARFYYEQCRAAAREPEQQAEWRIRMAELSLKEKKNEEAAGLYSQVLTDPALRNASYREGEVIASAGATADQRLRKLIAEVGPAIYKPFEEQAAALFAKARDTRDPAALQMVMEGYPNSSSSLAAAELLASVYRDKNDWENARKVLWWLEPRAKDEQQARAIAELVQACVQLRKFASAAAWAGRGVRQYKDVALKGSGGQATSFSDLAAQVASAAGSEVSGRLPAWPGVEGGRLLMETQPLDDSNVLPGRLLAPVETSPALRNPGLLFLLKQDTLRFYDPVKGKEIRAGVRLPQITQTVLMGTIGDTAVLLQNNRAIGVNISTGKLWSNAIRRPAGMAVGARSGEGIVAANRVVIVNGQQMVANAEGVTFDSDGNPVLRNGGDPELVRQQAFQQLGTLTFSTARLLNKRLLILSGNQLIAYDAITGEAAWKDHTGAPMPTVKLPEGTPVTVVGNEDLIVVQIDNGNSSTFYVLDADTGKFRKQFKIENETTDWRAVAEDGTLYTVSDNAVAAYDLVGDSTRPLWRRTDLEIRFPTASMLTLDGLIVVDSGGDAWCLSLDAGEMRWPAKQQLVVNLAQGPGAVLRTMLDGDLVLFQSSRNIQALRSVDGEGNSGPTQPSWKGTEPSNSPPFQSMQLANDYVVEFASGPVSGSQRGVRFVARNRKGGKLCLNQTLKKEGSNSEDGPQITSWQAVDGGIAMEVNREVHLWRTKGPIAPTTAPSSP